MLPQRHGDTEKRVLKDMKYSGESYRFGEIRKSLLLSLCLCVSVVISLSCGSKPTDPRAVIPADSLVYLETSDLGKMIEAITSNPQFLELAKSKPDTSVLNGMKLSVAVTGFQTSEEEISDQNAILNFKPRFVAVVETNAWNYQALSFADNKLGEFINEIYDGEVELVTSDKHGGKYFTWTAKDGRKAYALVRGSLILFGNDESALDRCVGVMNGEADSIAKNPKVAELSADALASGYVSKDGVGQIANIAGVSLAMAAGEESEVKSFISRVVPEIVRNSVTEVSWTARKAENDRIEDRYLFSLSPDTARVLGETIIPGGDEQNANFARSVPKEFVSATRYDLKGPQVAWRSFLLTARTKTDDVSGALLTEFSSSLFESYGIEDPELFLKSVSGSIQTVRFDADGDDVVVIARIVDPESIKKAVTKELNLSKLPLPTPSYPLNGPEWIAHSTDGELSVAADGNVILIGGTESVKKCLAANVEPSIEADSLRSSDAAVVTIGREVDPQANLVSVLAGKKKDDVSSMQSYLTETRFNQNGMERRTVSDFGLIGAIIGQLDRGN